MASNHQILILMGCFCRNILSGHFFLTSFVQPDSVRDCRQMTFDMFCGLKKCPLPQRPLFLTDNIKMNRTRTKIKRKIHALYITFQVLQVILIKICKIQTPDLLLLVIFISFYISRYLLSPIFRTSFNILWKNTLLSQVFLFCQIRSDCIPSWLLNDQNLLSVTFIDAPQVYHTNMLHAYLDPLLVYIFEQAEINLRYSHLRKKSDGRVI